MTAADPPEWWLQRWVEVSATCWARPGLCCRRCRVEALGGPNVSDRPESPGEPPTRDASDSARQAVSVDDRGPQRLLPSQPTTPTDHERPREAA